MGATILRLVSNEGPSFSPDALSGERPCTSPALGEQADALEIQFGRNPYSDFLRKHGVLPDPETAATIGRLLGGRVRASDGSLQPPLTEADRAWRRGVKARRAEWSRRSANINRLKTALALLCEYKDDPEQVLKDGGFDDSALREQLDFALSWLSRLNRFAEERSGNEAARAKSSTRVGQDCR
jgi:hypothetical protein